MNEQEPHRLALSDILESGAILVFRNVPVFLRMTAPLVVPVNAIYVALLLALGVHPVSKKVGYAIIAALLVAGLLVLILAAGACLKVASDLYRGERPGARASLSFVYSRFSSFLCLVMLILACAAPGVIIFFTRTLGRFGALALIPFALSLWLVGIWSVAPPAFLIEDKRVTQALKRSRELVRGHIGHALGTVILGSILALFAGILAEILASVFMTGGERVRLIVYISGVTLGEFLAIPLLAAYAIVLYYDLRLSEEDYRFDRAG